MQQKEEEGEWTLVLRPLDKDFWKPTNVSDLDNFPPPQPLKIKFNSPATHLTDAIPVGNGRLGAMLWGAVLSDTLNLNEDTLWTGNPHDYTDPNAPAALSEVRELVDAGKYAEATTAAEKLSDGPSEVYQFVGDVKLEFDDSHAGYGKDSYKRELDLDNSVGKVTYSVGEVVFTRELFVSFPDQVIVARISSSKPSSLSFTAFFDSKMHHESYSKGGNRIIMEGSCPGKRIPPRFNFETDNPKGIQFTTILDVQISNGNGSVSVLDNRKLKVEGCDWAVMKLVVSSSFEGPFVKPSESKRDPTAECLRVLDSISGLSFDNLYARHLDDYQSLFHRVSIQLSKNPKSAGEESTADRVKSFGEDEDPSLVELLFQYGRYLLISCSRPGTQVANLQGIWNKDIEPPWDGAQHLNINLQMNYWPSLPCNLRECQEPLFDYISILSVNGSKTAKVNYESRGWVAHQLSDLWAKTNPDRGQAVWALWPMGGAWLCTHLWEHYSYTMDKEFLEHKAYPLIEGCALFLLDWLIEGRDGFLETNPSTSPEHMFIAPDGKPASVSYSSTMDMAIIKEIFSIVVNASEVLGKSGDDLVGRVLKAQMKLPPTRIARDGSIMEWALDFQDPEVHHRHVSHLFGLFPGHTITPEKNPDLCKAADYTPFKRGEEGPGWSTTWKTALWARLRNSESAYKMVKHLFTLVDPENETAFEGGLYSNLFTAHPPFQIDANFGFSAAIAEMLVQSTTKDIYLLPALPREKWANGCVKGLKARGGTTINICWKEGNLHQVGIWSKDKISCLKLNYRGITVVANALPGMIYTFDYRLKCINTSNLSDGSYDMDISFSYSKSYL